ncbi:MAG: metallophosphoesterase [Lachnospiraceae bacterium]|nr:metallophosphoesterase [Lachnospiraceae bacterium]
MASFRIKKYQINTKKLPAGKGLTFVLLADLHNKEYGPENKRLIAAVKEQKPDGILIAGDMLVGHTAQSFLPAQRLVLALQEQVAPVFYGNGNHESRMRVQTEIYGDRYREYMEPLSRAGVQVLSNASTRFEKMGCQVEIHGFELDLSYYQKLGDKELEPVALTEALGSPGTGIYHILLAHNPVYFRQYAAWGADMTLSGHLHGGVIRIPFLGGVITPQVRLFPKYDRGLFWIGEKALLVSPGLGTHTVNIRIFNPAQLFVIRLEGEA